MRTMLTVISGAAALALGLPGGPAAAQSLAGDVGTAECRAAQLEAQEAASAVALGARNAGTVVAAAARVAGALVEGEAITEECGSCIVRQFALGIPISEQEPCGPDEPVVTCPQACAQGLEDFTTTLLAIDPEPELITSSCEFDVFRQAGSVDVIYNIELPNTILILGNVCSAFIEPTFFASTSLTNEEQARCAEFAVGFLPGVDETNCDISPP